MTDSLADVIKVGAVGIVLAAAIFLFVIAVDVLRRDIARIERHTAWLIKDTARLEAEASELRAMIKAREILR